MSYLEASPPPCALLAESTWLQAQPRLCAVENELNEVRMGPGSAGSQVPRRPGKWSAHAAANCPTVVSSLLSLLCPPQRVTEQLQSLQRELERTRASEEQKDAELEDASEVAKVKPYTVTRSHLHACYHRLAGFPRAADQTVAQVLTSELERLGEVVSQQSAELQELRSRQNDVVQVYSSLYLTCCLPRVAPDPACSALWNSSQGKSSLFGGLASNLACLGPGGAAQSQGNGDRGGSEEGRR